MFLDEFDLDVFDEIYVEDEDIEEELLLVEGVVLFRKKSNLENFRF